MTSASVASRRLLYPTLTAPIASIVTGIFLHRHPDKCHVGQRLGAISPTAGALIMFALTFSNNESKGEWYFIARLMGARGNGSDVHIEPYRHSQHLRHR